MLWHLTALDWSHRSTELRQRHDVVSTDSRSEGLFQAIRFHPEFLGGNHVLLCIDHEPESRADRLAQQIGGQFSETTEMRNMQCSDAKATSTTTPY